MTESYSLSEVFRIAEVIERNGHEFYVRAAKQVETPAIRQVLLDLAEKEKHHLAFFQELHNQCCSQTDVHWVDPDGQAQAYLDSIANCHVFYLDPDIPELLAALHSPESVLRLAINFERDTVAYFTALRTTVPDSHRDKVDLLIQEELSHIRELRDAINTL